MKVFERIGFLVLLLGLCLSQAHAQDCGVDMSMEAFFVHDDLDASQAHVGDEIYYLIHITNPPGHALMTGELFLLTPDGTFIDVDYSVILYEESISYDSRDYPGGRYTVSSTYLDPNDKVHAFAYLYGICDYPPPEPNFSEAVASIKVLLPSIKVDKTVEPTTAKVGDEVLYTIEICNRGNTDLTLTEIHDNQLGDIPISPECKALTNGECCTITIPYIIQPGDPDPLINEVCVTAVDALGGSEGTVSDCNIASVDLVDTIGEEGCMPGYWKNSPGCWECVEPDTLFSDVFGVCITVRAGNKKTITDPTLMQALNASGGGVNALVRHAVAALLNSCDRDIAYPMPEAELILEVERVLTEGDKYEIEGLKDMLDMYNSYGCGQSSDDAHIPCSPSEDE